MLCFINNILMGVVSGGFPVSGPEKIWIAPAGGSLLGSGCNDLGV